jgi:phosphohistidine phosphatase
MKRLYIVRHAIAVPHGTPGVAEEDRPLTPDGINKIEKAARGLRALESVPDLILSSPLPRARQTADILVCTLSKNIPLKMSDALAPGGSRTELYREIFEQRELDSIMLVGHQPSLGEVAGEIAWGSVEQYVELKKGGACALELEALRPKPRGSLLWLLTPSILRQLGRG